MTNKIPRSTNAPLSVNDTLPTAGPGPLPNASDNLDRLEAEGNANLNQMGIETPQEPPQAPLPSLGNDLADAEPVEPRMPADPVRVAQAASMPGTMFDVQPQPLDRLDDIYRVAQSERQSAESLDWLMKQTGGYPPPPAPGQQPQGKPRRLLPQSRKAACPGRRTRISIPKPGSSKTGPS